MELDGFRVPFGDGSLRLMDPRHSEHTGSYTCVFSMPYNTHTEHTDVTIEDPVGEVTNTNTVRAQRGLCANSFTEATGPDKYNHVLVRLSTLLNFLSVALVPLSHIYFMEELHRTDDPCCCFFGENCQL